MSILYVPEAQNVCMWHRCIVPGTILQHNGYKVSINLKPKYGDINLNDVTVFSRNRLNNMEKLLNYGKKNKKFLVYDIDDDFWSIPQTNNDHNHYSNPEYLKLVEESIKTVDLVTTTTETLKNKFIEWNPNIKILPNMLGTEYLGIQNPVNQKEEEIIIGWAGTNTHLGDLTLLNKVVKEIISKYDNVYFAFAGMGQLPFEPNDKIRVYQGAPFQEYHRLLSNFHIGIAPLENSVFNAAKSDLKFIEYAGLGIPVVASNVISYNQTLNHGETGFLVNNEDEWINYLSQLIENKNLRIEMGQKAFEYGKSRNIKNNIHLWEEAYNLTF